MPLKLSFPLHCNVSCFFNRHKKKCSLNNCLIFSFPQNISFKSYSRDSGHGGSEQEDSPRTHNAMTLGHSGRTRDRRAIGDGNEIGNGRTTGRRAASPYNHTYTEIRDGGRSGVGVSGNGIYHPGIRDLAHHQNHGNHIHAMSRGIVGEDDPVYEEIERGVGEIQVSDLSDEDGRRQSDMSRQSSRSYGDHRPLIPYSPANDRNLIHYGQTVERNVLHFDPSQYSPAQERSLNACWEKLRRQPAKYELGEMPRMPGNYGIPQQDHTRTVAVLDGHTVVCHLQPQTDMYTGRGMPPPSYSEC